jgi:hypothetical protein
MMTAVNTLTVAAAVIAVVLLVVGLWRIKRPRPPVF